MSFSGGGSAAAHYVKSVIFVQNVNYDISYFAIKCSCWELKKYFFFPKYAHIVVIWNHNFYKKFSSNLIFGQKCGLLEQCEQEQE